MLLDCIEQQQHRFHFPKAPEGIKRNIRRECPKKNWPNLAEVQSRWQRNQANVGSGLMTFNERKAMEGSSPALIGHSLFHALCFSEVYNSSCFLFLMRWLPSRQTTVERMVFWHSFHVTIILYNCSRSKFETLIFQGLNFWSLWSLELILLYLSKNGNKWHDISNSKTCAWHQYTHICKQCIKYVRSQRSMHPTTFSPSKFQAWQPDL